MKSNSWWVYIIECQSGKLYTGISTDPERRFLEHRDDPKKGAKFFRGDKPSKIIFRNECENRAEASKKEYRIKSLTLKKKKELIAGDLSLLI